MLIKELPQEYVNVLITYSCDVYVRDKYYGHNEFRTVTRLAFTVNQTATMILKTSG